MNRRAHFSAVSFMKSLLSTSTINCLFCNWTTQKTYSNIQCTGRGIYRLLAIILLLLATLLHLSTAFTFGGQTQVNATEGQNATITYILENIPSNTDYNVQWTKDGDKLNTNDPRITPHVDRKAGKFTLGIHNIQPLDGGKYAVILNNVTSWETKLNVIRKPSTDPIIELTRTTNGLATLRCVYEKNFPITKIYFFEDDKPQPVQTNDTYISVKYSQEVPFKPNRADESITCIVNFLGFDSRYEPINQTVINTFLSKTDDQIMEEIVLHNQTDIKAHSSTPVIVVSLFAGIVILSTCLITILWSVRPQYIPNWVQRCLSNCTSNSHRRISEPLSNPLTEPQRELLHELLQKPLPEPPPELLQNPLPEPIPERHNNMEPFWV